MRNLLALLDLQSSPAVVHHVCGAAAMGQQVWEAGKRSYKAQPSGARLTQEHNGGSKLTTAPHGARDLTFS